MATYTYIYVFCSRSRCWDFSQTCLQLSSPELMRKLPNTDCSRGHVFTHESVTTTPATTVLGRAAREAENNTNPRFSASLSSSDKLHEKESSQENSEQEIFKFFQKFQEISLKGNLNLIRLDFLESSDEILLKSSEEIL